MALTCWKDSIMPDTYEVDHDAITDRPYISIRKVERVDEEYDVDELREMKRLSKQEAAEEGDRSRLKAFISKLNERL
jgi:hypothetical protein